MPYLNSRLHALVAMGLLLLTAPSLLAQDETAVVSTEIRGDVDGDGRVTAADAVALRAYLVRGTVPAGRDITSVGDANADGRVTAADAALISRFAAGVDVSRFPVGRRMDDTGETTDGSRSLLALFDCTSSPSGETSCQPVSGSDAASLDIIVGQPYVTMGSSFVSVSNGNAANPDTTTYNWTITNQMSQPIGTTDGTTPHANGTRVFFLKGPTATSAVPGTTQALKNLGVTPIGPTGSFVSAQGTSWKNRKYFQFDGVILEDSSVARNVSFVYDRRVLTFNFQLLVATPVPFDRGWLTIAPADSLFIVAPDSAVSLTGTQFNHLSENLGPSGIDWTSSSSGVATVSSSGEVTAVAEGTTIIKAISSTHSVRRDSTTIIVDRFPEVVSTDPADGDVNISPDTTIQITFSEPVNVTTNSFDLKCPSSGSALPYAISGDGTATITLTPSGDLPSGTVCEVTVKGNQVQDADSNDGPNFMPGQYVFDFEVGIQALADSLTSTTTGNVRINTASTSPVFSVTTNDKIGPATTITFAGWNAVAGKTQQGGDVVMTMSGAGMGQFTYNPPAGYTGVDSLEYTIASGSATSTARVALPVSGMIWFVNNAGAACTTRASGCGRLTNPYNTLAAFHAENNGTGNNPAAGDNVFLYESAAAYTGPVALLAQQKLIGQDAGASLSAITGITPATGSDPLPGMNPGANTVNINGASGGVVLANIAATSGANNTVRGLSIGTSGGAGLSGTSFGSPVIEEVPISVTGGPSLSLSGGTMNSTFATASSSASSTQGISLTNVSGTLTFGSGTSLTNSAGTGLFVSGAAPTITYSGGISKNAAIPGRLVEINNVTGGTITFNTGTLTSTSTAGTGIQLSNADGAVNFNGTVTLTGGDNGVDIISGSSGAIDFDAATITNPSGEALRIFNGNGGDQAANVTFAGAISTNAGRPVLIEDVSSGTVAVTASISTTAGLGMLVQNNTGGTFAFSNATKTLSTATNAAVTLSGNANTTVNFTGGGLAITTTSGAGFSATSSTGGTVTVEGSNNTITTATGNALAVTDVNIGGGGLTFRSITAGTAASGPANGIRLSNTGTLGFVTVTGDGSTAGSGGTIQRTSGGDGAVDGNGVYLNGTRNVSLSFMNFNDHPNNGLFGTGVRGLTMNRVRFTGNNGNSNSGTFNESAVQLVAVGGAVKFSGSRFDGGAYNAVRVDNSNGTAPALDSLVFVNDTIATMQGSTADVRGSALLVNLMDGTADVRVRDSRVLAWWSTGIHVLSQGTASATARITNNFVDNTNGALAGAMGIVAAGCRLGFNVSGNTVRHTNGAAISTDMSPGCVNTVQGTIDGNFIGVSGDVNSGTATGVAIAAGGRAGTTTVKISNNVLRQINGSANGAITVVAGDNVLYGGSGTLNATISGNNIQETGSTVNSAQHGILVTHGTTSSGAGDSHQGCYDILSNTIANLNTASGAAAQNRIRVNQRFSTTSRWPGYTGGQFSTTDLGTYLLSRNTASNATNANTSTGGFLNTAPAGSACPQPSM